MNWDITFGILAGISLIAALVIIVAASFNGLRNGHIAAAATLAVAGAVFAGAAGS